MLGATLEPSGCCKGSQVPGSPLHIQLDRQTEYTWARAVTSVTISPRSQRSGPGTRKIPPRCRLEQDVRDWAELGRSASMPKEGPELSLR